MLSSYFLRNEGLCYVHRQRRITKKTAFTVKKILYIHYLASPAEGGLTHVRGFVNAFSQICDQRDIDFKVIAPPLQDRPISYGHGKKTLKQHLSQFYLGDVKWTLDERRNYKNDIAMLQAEKPDAVLIRWDAHHISIFRACHDLGIPVIAEVNGSESERAGGTRKRLPWVEHATSQKYLTEITDGMFVVSQVIKDELLEKIDYDFDVRVVPNGADCERFDPAIDGSEVRTKFGVESDQVVIGYVGTFHPWHRVDMLLEAFIKVVKEQPQARLMLVGKTQPNGEAVKARAKAADVEDKVLFTERVDSDLVPNYLAAMDIVVLPNTQYYCSPLKLFEYMAMGRAVVSISTPPIDEMIPQGAGLTFPREDEEVLKQHLITLCADDDLRKSTGEQARKVMLDSYTWGHNAEAIFSLLQDAYERKAK